MRLPILAVISAGLLYAPYSIAASKSIPEPETTTVAITSVAPAQPNGQAQSSLPSIPAATAPVTPTTVATQTTQSIPATTTAKNPTPTTTTNTATSTTVTMPVSALATEKDKISYSIGVDLGQNFKAQQIDVDPTLLSQGLKDGLTGNNTLLTKQQMIETLTAFQKQLVAKRQADALAAAQKNLQEGKAYLEANKKKPGVITTASGLQYKIINPGKGENPTANDQVTVDYAGSFINGKVFDSSYERKKSVTFPVSEVIPGWSEAVKLMKPDATFEIVVPPSLAYGERGMSNVIGPNQTLLFKIHLVSINKTPANKQ